MATDASKMMKVTTATEENFIVKDRQQSHSPPPAMISSPYASKSKASAEEILKASPRLCNKSPDVPPKLPSHRTRSPRTCFAAGHRNFSLSDDVSSSSTTFTPVRVVNRSISDVSMESAFLLSPGDCDDDDYDSVESSESDICADECYDASAARSRGDGSVEDTIASSTSTSDITEDNNDEGTNDDCGIDLGGLNLGGISRHETKFPLNRSCRSSGADVGFEDFEIPVATFDITRGTADSIPVTPKSRRDEFLTHGGRSRDGRLSLRAQLHSSSRSLDSLPVLPTRRGSMRNAQWDDSNTRRSFNSFSPMDCCETAVSDKSPSVPLRRETGRHTVKHDEITVKVQLG